MKSKGNDIQGPGLLVRPKPWNRKENLLVPHRTELSYPVGIWRLPTSEFNMAPVWMAHGRVKGIYLRCGGQIGRRAGGEKMRKA